MSPSGRIWSKALYMVMSSQKGDLLWERAVKEANEWFEWMDIKPTDTELQEMVVSIYACLDAHHP